MKPLILATALAIAPAPAYAAQAAKRSAAASSAAVRLVVRRQFVRLGGEMRLGALLRLPPVHLAAALAAALASRAAAGATFASDATGTAEVSTRPGSPAWRR